MLCPNICRQSQKQNFSRGFRGLDVLQGTLKMMKCVTLTPTRSVTLTNPSPKHNLTAIH